jgi:hypothetical protein
MGSSVGTVDTTVLHGPRGAQELPPPTPFSWKSSHVEPGSAHLHVLFGRMNHGPPMVVLGVCM